MFKALFLYKLISNTVILIRDQSTVYIVTLYFLNAINCILNTELFITMSIPAGIFLLIIYTNYILGLQRAIIIFFYSYVLYGFSGAVITTGYSNIIGILFLIGSSVFTLILFLTNTRKNDLGFFYAFRIFISSPKEFILLVLSATALSRIIKVFVLKDFFGLPYFDITAHVFVIFSLIVPTIIITRIIYNILLDIII